MFFFCGVCNYINPEQCQMIDVGTIPQKNSISAIILEMDKPKNKHLGGCCGEIEVFWPNNYELGKQIF